MPPPAKKKPETGLQTMKTKKKSMDPFWLPDELFQAIFQYLSWDNVKSCRLVSRKWKSLVDHSSVLKCAAMNVIQSDNIEERIQSEMFKLVGKVNLKQSYNLELIDEYAIYLKENSIKADLTNIHEIYASLSHFLSPPTLVTLVVSLVKSKNSTRVSTHLEVKNLTACHTPGLEIESAEDIARLMKRIVNGEVRVESLDLSDFDVSVDGEFETVYGEQLGGGVNGPEFFIESLVKAVCLCKEAKLCYHSDPKGGDVGPYQPKVMNEILRAVAKTPASKLKLKKLEFDFWTDYELGVAHNGHHGDVGGEGLEPEVFAAAVCNLEEVRFHEIPVHPWLEEEMFKAISDTPIESAVLKTLQIDCVTTKAELLASAALKLVDLEIKMSMQKYASGNHHDQCIQARAILDRVHKSKTLRLEILKIGLYDKIYHGRWKTEYYPRTKWSYPQVKMEEIKAKLKKLEIDDHTNDDRDEEEERFYSDSDGDDDNKCAMQ